MPPTDDSTRPPRRSLGRGPGTDRGGSPAPAVPAQEGLERGGADGDRATVAPGEPTAPLPAASTSGPAAGADEPQGPGSPLRGDNGPSGGPEAVAEPVTASEPGRGEAEGPGSPPRGGGREPETAVAAPTPGRADVTRLPRGPEPAAPEAGPVADGGGDEVPYEVPDPGRPPRGGEGRTAAAAEAGQAAPQPAAPVVPATPSAVPATPSAEPVAAHRTPDDGRFKVRLANFEGPFDLLLQLISKHKLDVTEVALSKVTDEFMVHIRAMGPDWDLDQTTEFLVVAATLLDLKAARLLPAAEVEDEADLALLEARDLLFARLLQYRAYKQIAEIFSARLDAEGKRYPRTVGLEDHHAELLPEVVISIGAEGFARLAVKAMQPRPRPQVYIDHIHAPLVSVREQAEVVVARLREAGAVSFRELAADAPDTLTVVARFLALLELYREKAVILEQEDALGELMVRWAGGGDAEQPLVTDEFDQEVRENQEQEGNA
ncbi:segregation/condensation protein A [Streptomyces sp. NPDC005279]|uniref:segregation/condensation protein A n=1 Tax=Streptomyces sp. NPDC005279 TaxID=3364712 RepID=UPI003676CCE8